MSGSSSDRQQQEGELRVSDVSGHTAPLFRLEEDVVFLSPVFMRAGVFFTAALCHRERQQLELWLISLLKNRVWWLVLPGFKYH